MCVSEVSCCRNRRVENLSGGINFGSPTQNPNRIKYLIGNMHAYLRVRWMLKIFKLKDIEATPGHGVNMIHREFMGKDTGAKFTVVYNILREGGKGPYPPHKHIYEHCMYIVRGLGRMTSGGESRVVEAGDFIFIPSNELHSNENIGTGELHFIGFNV